MTTVLKGVDLKTFDKLCDELIAKHEKDMNPENADRSEVPEPIAENTVLEAVEVTPSEEIVKEVSLEDMHTTFKDNGVTSAESMAEPEPVVIQPKQDAIPKTKSNNPGRVIVTNLETKNVLEFDNAVLAANHFKIHPTTVRTRCSTNKDIHGLNWKYE